MSADLKPYRAIYKHSCACEWLGEVPEHWKQLPIIACYRERQVPNTGWLAENGSVTQLRDEAK